MENASKALIMAGAILIAIILISLGLQIVSPNKGVTNQLGDLSSSMEVSMFNSQFTQYEGVRRGTEVNDLIRKINLNNTRNSNRQIVVPESLTISVTKIYEVSFKDENKDGYVDLVDIIESSI